MKNDECVREARDRMVYIQTVTKQTWNIEGSLLDHPVIERIKKEAFPLEKYVTVFQAFYFR